MRFIEVLYIWPHPIVLLRFKPHLKEIKFHDSEKGRVGHRLSTPQ